MPNTKYDEVRVVDYSNYYHGKLRGPKLWKIEYLDCSGNWEPVSGGYSTKTQALLNTEDVYKAYF